MTTDSTLDQRREIAETMADRSGDDLWLQTANCPQFDQFDSVDAAIEFIEANSETPENYDRVAS